MLSSVGRRFLLSVVTLAMVSVVVFTATELLPGDAATARLGREATPESLAAFRAAEGLDRPALARFLSWARKVLTGDLGVSSGRRKGVGELLRVRSRNTFLLGGVAACIGFPLAIALGIAAALTRDRAVDLTLSGLAIGVMSVPSFVAAILLTLVFSIWLGVLPAVTVTAADAPLAALLPDIVLPAATLVLVIVAPMLGMVRARMIDVMASEFVRMALLRGVPRAKVVWRYALPNALLPAIQVGALMASSILGGLVIIETVFNYPGLGTLTISAIRDRDVPLLQGIALLLSAVSILVSLAADLLTLTLNPRVRTWRGFTRLSR